MISSVLTVTQVNTFLKSLIDGDGRLQDFFVSGEISNYTCHYKSGHLYFSLKDEKSVLKSVMFATSAKRLKFSPENGMKVIARGRVSVYEPSGQYQLYVQNLQPDGIGALSLAFEQRKAKLEKEGLFDQSCKQLLPRYPEVIAVITSPTGAAVRDILQITARRWPLASILLCPVLVQGEGAPAQLTKALREVNAGQAADVIILGRGGGSLEDLQAFNDEELAREVFASEIPVVSAVGHETDFTICDFVADLRAPTPSAAAELCTPDIRDEMSRLSVLNESFSQRGRELVEYHRQRLDILVGDSALSSTDILLSRQKERINELTKSLQQIIKDQMLNRQHEYRLLNEKLDALSPLRILSRGFAVCYDMDDNVLQSVKQVNEGDSIYVCLADGRFDASVEKVGQTDE